LHGIYVVIIKDIVLGKWQGFIQWRGWGGSFLPKTPSFPPKGKRERREESIYFFAAAIQVISNPQVKLFLRALDKTIPPKHIIQQWGGGGVREGA
jgi:hypothetical protein